MADKVLIAAPTYSGKAYCLSPYLYAVQNQTYPNYEAVLVDNTRGTTDYAKEIQAYGVNSYHFEPPPRWVETQYIAWETIYKHALKVGADWVLSLEQDVIVPLTALAQMVAYAQEHDLCLLVHDYPARPSTGFTGNMEELGCTLIGIEDLGWVIQTVQAAKGRPVNFVGILRSITSPAMARVHLFEAQHLDDGPEAPWEYTDPDARLLPEGKDPAKFARGEWK